ncbi:hypothetical protein LR48_Vigan50s005800 [Vigna angularis]|uniref:histone acetyltransferase n=1 Tax=Phaseolus angularis TaxID=3914 RepID=A0A0L9T3I8_PHAAN|nr:hypothetical protein LR48_Vigan50s005800 [Vigna angularis]
MESHGGGPLRSRSSQSPSPSHSASASATSSIHKRKRASEDHAPPFPPSSFSADTRDGALTSNDDLESISARGADSDSDDDSEDAVVDDDEEDYDNDSSMRTFTASRLGNPPSAPRNTKLKTDNSAVKIENSDGAKDAANAGAGAMEIGPVPSIVVKEDPTKIFTDNLQTSGAYTAREESLKKEEEAGRLKFVCHSNDGVDEHMVWLIGLKNIFARQLPNMPKEYIVRLVMDRSHKSVMVIRRNHVVGGITYRPYASQKFGEIAFCAITADEQVKGYGTRLMNHLKQYARDVDGLTHFLTYADNNAVGYFIKQGFTKEIHLEKDRWQGYIKDYDGGILMECKIDPKLPYTDLSTMIRRQRQTFLYYIHTLTAKVCAVEGLSEKVTAESYVIRWAGKYTREGGIGEREGVGRAPNEGERPGRAVDEGELPGRALDKGERPRRAGERPGQAVVEGERPGRAVEEGERPGRAVVEGERPGRAVEEGERPRRAVVEGELPGRALVEGERPGQAAIDEKIRELSNCHIVYTGIDFQKKEAGIPKKIIDDIPGLREAGWTPDQWGHSRFRSLNSMLEHADAWPFKEPVDARDVPDYYDIIKDPMDLKTMSKRVESELYYVTFEMFVADVRRMFANARTYNSPETIYYKCATRHVLALPPPTLPFSCDVSYIYDFQCRLESHFQSKVQAGLQSG